MAETNLPSTLAKFPPRFKTVFLTGTGRKLIETKDLSCYPKNVPEKSKSLEELTAIAAAARAKGQTVVFTNGCFDLLHRGHLHTLRQAKAAGDLLIVAINSDRSVKSIKAPQRPILPETDRLELIAALEMVDYVILFDEPDPYTLIAAIKPQVLAKGGDWSSEKIIGADIVEAAGGRVAVIPYLKGISTTAIIERIKHLDG
ncbi:MAG TPA: D-glycero-beta-D-manno-heptose 1-phosphate adenylyltransferase [Candidatus Binatia bacterium]|nr:D-glycero-beta-D-manno-heptose 1-phosphate adenylyltransferase [Candidatus Binatia bacterium]